MENAAQEQGAGTVLMAEELLASKHCKSSYN